MRSSSKSSSTQKPDYVQRINGVLDHIYAHLDQPLRLSLLAELADLSPFHFHRIFQAMVGETPSDFTKRLRLEKAIQLMCYGKRQTLSEIAHQCGFSSSSDFTRSFKARFGVAPSKWERNIAHRDGGVQEDSITMFATRQLPRPLSRANPDGFRVRIRELPARYVAYIRVANPYQGDGVIQACHRLMQWAEARQIADRPWLGYQYENPTITELDACYYCIGVELEKRLNPHGEIGVHRFPPMLVAEVEMKGGIDLEIKILQWLYGSWLPRSQYLPDDQPCIEAWLGKPYAHGDSHFELRIQLPICPRDFRS